MRRSCRRVVVRRRASEKATTYHAPVDAASTGDGPTGPAAPAYIDALLPDFLTGEPGRFNHLGHWDGADSLADAQLRMNDLIVGLAGIRSGSRVLDVGSGFGGTLSALAARFDDMQLTGVDVDERQLVRCRAIAPSTGNVMSWVRADACDLPFDDATFDHVVSIEAMWHFPSRGRFLGELARVLRRGGGAAVVDILVRPEAAEAMGVADEELVAVLRQGFAPWPDPFASIESVLEVAADVGLEQTSVIDATVATKRTYDDHSDSHQRPGASEFSASASVRTFVELHLRDLLQIVYIGWRRADR